MESGKMTAYDLTNIHRRLYYGLPIDLTPVTGGITSIDNIKRALRMGGRSFAEKMLTKSGLSDGRVQELIEAAEAL